MKVHVFASDLLPLPGLPTSGGGLRSWQLIQGLREKGVETTHSMPANVFLGKQFADAIPAEEIDRAWDFDNQERILERFAPDVAIWCNAPTLRVSPDWGGKTRFVADLHGPINMESVFVTGKSLALTTAEVVGLLGQFDGFSCVSERQRYYWTGLLCAAGRLIDDVPFEIVPLRCEPSMENREIANELRLIYAGGFYPWQNCIDSLLVIGEEMERAGKGRLDLFGGVHEFSDSPRFQDLFERLKTFDRVHMHGFVARSELREFYRRASCAVDLMEKNIERELAVTTRTVEYLAEGIPPIYNNYNILSTIIAENNAGWCLDPRDLEGLRGLLRSLFEDGGDEVRARSANAARIYREILTTARTIEPLERLCRSLSREAPARGAVAKTNGKGGSLPRKPFHKRFYYAWQALRGKNMKVLR